jgi:hypothetical protein
LDEDGRRRRAGVDPSHGNTAIYRQAFVRIGGEDAFHILNELLSDEQFGFDAAVAMREIDNVKGESPLARGFASPDLSSALAPDDISNTSDSRSGNAIAGEIDRLLKEEPTKENLERAMQLGKLLLVGPSTQKGRLLQALLDLSLPISAKRELLAAAALSGQLVSERLLEQGVNDWLDKCQAEGWRLRERVWEIESWLELFPASDDPRAITLALDKVMAVLPEYNRRLDRIPRALGHARAVENEDALFECFEKYPYIVTLDEWFRAFFARQSTSCTLRLLDWLAQATLSSSRQPVDFWLSRALGEQLSTDEVLLMELLRRYPSSSDGFNRLMSEALAEASDPRILTKIFEYYSQIGRPFDGVLRSAIDHVAVTQRPSDSWQGAYETVPVAIPELRKWLFAKLPGAPYEAQLAESCLNYIDYLRDDRGAADFEPRHPDIDSGRPWPLVKMANEDFD